MQAKRLSNHEDLTGKTKIAHEVRQDRHKAEGRVLVEISGHRTEVTNFSIFGFAFLSETKPEIGSVIKEAKMYVNDHSIGSFDIVIRRIQTYGDNYEIGTELLSQTLPVDTLRYIIEINDFWGSLADKSARVESLPQSFRLDVLELRSRLSQVEQLVNSFEQRPYQNRFERETAFETIVETMSKQIFDDIRETNHRLQKAIEHRPEEVMKLSFQYFRDILGQYIYQSPFTRRSFEKPRGYAGDFEMMNQIYKNDGHADSLFGSCMEKAVQLHEEPRAVRNRSVYLADNIVSLVKSVSSPVDILAVACGPAEEIKKSIQQLSNAELERCNFYLLDQDEDALKYAQKNIRLVCAELGKTANITLINKGIKEVLLEGGTGRKFDLIYSAGLFDYFSDPVATRAGLAFANALNPKGRLIIGNFNISSPNWFGMLTLFDWRLILRSEADLARLFGYDGYRLEIESEPENVNLFCKIHKN